jgi:DNA-binding CsgD family transcriptional regulator
MVKELKNLKLQEVNLLFKIIQNLSITTDLYAVRKGIAEDILRLLNADFFASYVWNHDLKIFEKCVFTNMHPDNLARYEKYFQYHDPITYRLQKRRSATVVSEIMPQNLLEKTEFFNDFLMQDGLHHGINLYAYDGYLNIGDMRIWRARNRPIFGHREVALLDTILPYFTNSLRIARIMETARGMENFWKQLIEDAQIPLFLYDSDNKLFYENHAAREMEKSLSASLKCSSFSDYVHHSLKEGIGGTEWKGYSLSIFRGISPINPRPVTAVMVHNLNPQIMDEESLRKKHHLTSREADICMLVYRGLTDSEIASVIGIAFSTVRTHLKHLFQKMDVTTRSELIYSLIDK